MPADDSSNPVNNLYGSIAEPVEQFVQGSIIGYDEGWSVLVEGLESRHVDELSDIEEVSNVLATMSGEELQRRERSRGYRLKAYEAAYRAGITEINGADLMEIDGSVYSLSKGRDRGFPVQVVDLDFYDRSSHSVESRVEDSARFGKPGGLSMYVADDISDYEVNGELVAIEDEFEASIVPSYWQ